MPCPAACPTVQIRNARPGPLLGEARAGRHDDTGNRSAEEATVEQRQGLAVLAAAALTFPASRSADDATARGCKDTLTGGRLVMRPWTRWLWPAAGLAAVFVASSSIVLAVRQDSWTPIIAVGWIPAVVVAAWGGARRRRLSRPRGAAG